MLIFRIYDVACGTCLYTMVELSIMGIGVRRFNSLENQPVCEFLMLITNFSNETDGLNFGFLVLITQLFRKIFGCTLILGIQLAFSIGKFGQFWY